MATISPATSVPVEVSFGFLIPVINLDSPKRAFAPLLADVSTVFIDEACTLTSISSSSNIGVAISLISIISGGPYFSTTAAFSFGNLQRDDGLLFYLFSFYFYSSILCLL
jgi:hypothetical protein